ncbi:hypothetical protein OF83DRAFT_65518 [Amylostereum chailletii]|nr:hypothetical protein OF83DRAFT_65518 [Amylostereum chailletii]
MFKNTSTIEKRPHEDTPGLEEDTGKRRRIEVEEDMQAGPSHERAVSEHIPYDPDIVHYNHNTPSPPPPPPAPEFVSARSGRPVKFPSRYNDFLPAKRTPLQHIPSAPDRQPPRPPCQQEHTPEPLSPEPEAIPDPPSTVFQTEHDMFGLYRVYPQAPTVTPNETLAQACDAETLRMDGPPPPSAPLLQDLASGDEPPFFAPFSSATAAVLMVCSGTESQVQSAAQTQRLARMLGPSEDDPADLARNLDKFTYASESARMDHHLEAVDTPLHERDGWKRSSVTISLPCDGVKQPEADVPKLLINNVYHRDIIDVLVTTFESDTAQTFHMTPFEHFWQPEPDSPAQRVYSEVYTADAMLEAYTEVQALPREPGDDLEHVVAGMLAASDSTHLANFGSASLWPIYKWWGNQSKYPRCKPSSHACNNMAHIPSLPADIQETFERHFGKPATAAILAHCKRELVHGVWELLLDERFMDAYRNGIVVRCGDGIVRRIYPRLLIYSADYPEKVILATIKALANCPCPRCLVEKHQVIRMGMKSDIRLRKTKAWHDDDTRKKAVNHARQLMFASGLAITSTRVQDWMKPLSLVPTRNVFSEKLGPEGFDYHKMLADDPLHEFELGTWKSILTHLIRLLYAAAGDKMQVFNARFRRVPTFQRSTIHRFHHNVSGLKKLAARDFEDILQCIIPVFEGLMDPPHDKIISDMLFDLVTWHAYAKLRLHTDTTLAFFREVTQDLGDSVRKFEKIVCSIYDTRELPHKTAACGRRHAALIKKHPSTGVPVNLAATHKSLNLSTYKWHSLGHYPTSVPWFGTSDNGSTQTSELQHRRATRHFVRTNKNDLLRQMAKQDARERLLLRVGKRITQHIKRKVGPNKHKSHGARRLSDRLPPTDPALHYHISKTATSRFHMGTWLSENEGDPALATFFDDLHDHILARLLGLDYDGGERVIIIYLKYC